jgi:hypothetical protein
MGMSFIGENMGQLYKQTGKSRFWREVLPVSKKALYFFRLATLVSPKYREEHWKIW